MSILLRRRELLVGQLELPGVLYDASRFYGAENFICSIAQTSTSTSGTVTYSPLKVAGNTRVMEIYAANKSSGSGARTATGAFRTIEKVNLAGYTTLKFLVKYARNTMTAASGVTQIFRAGLCCIPDKDKDAWEICLSNHQFSGGYTWSEREKSSTYLNNTVVSVDVSALDEAYVGGAVYAYRSTPGTNSNVMRIEKIWLE